MRQVSRDEFLKPIFARGLDVHPSIISNFPYTSIWQFHRQMGSPAYGKTVDRVERGQTVTEYFVA